jgi:hypothetical protein
LLTASDFPFLVHKSGLSPEFSNLQKLIVFGRHHKTAEVRSTLLSMLCRKAMLVAS